jgi:PEP-CTERM motif
MRSFHYLFVAAALAVPTVSSAATVIGGATRIEISQALAGFQLGLLGSATLVSAAPITGQFPITGGNLDASLAGTIEHEGSGLSISNGADIVTLSNFIIDTTAGLVFGDVTLAGLDYASDAPLFSFDLASVTVAQLIDLDNPLLALTITPTASLALDTAFAIGSTAGVVAGAAATAPVLSAAVPEPASWAMLIAGFGLTGAALRRRRPLPAAA